MRAFHHFGRLLFVTAITVLLAAASSQSYFLHAQEKWAVCDLSANFLREEASYSAELGTQALMGTVMKVDAQKGDWFHMTTPEPYSAWAVDMGFALMDKEHVLQYIAAPKFMVVAEYTHVFVEPDKKGDRVCDLVAGDLLLQQRNGSGVVIKKGQYVAVSLPSGRQGWVLRSEVEDFGKWTSACKPDANHIIATAKKFVGVPYMWGGTSIKGVDCSGLTRTAFFLNGVLLPRNASQQARVGDPIPIEGVLQGDYSALQRGDLLFFGNRMTGRVTHVALYIGDGHIIHSSLLVRINSLTKGDADYYQGTSRLLCARRVIGREDSGKGVQSIAGSPYYFPGNGLLDPSGADIHLTSL